MTRWEKGAWVLFFAQLFLMGYSAWRGERPRDWLLGLCSGSGIGMLTGTLLFWPLISRAQKARDAWFDIAIGKTDQKQ